MSTLENFAKSRKRLISYLGLYRNFATWTKVYFIMGCSSSTATAADATAISKEAQRKAKKAEEDALEMELQRLMHERQVRLAGQARPLLESRSSLRDFNNNSNENQNVEVPEEVLRKRAQVRQTIALREAVADRKWVVCELSCVCLDVY